LPAFWSRTPTWYPTSSTPPGLNLPEDKQLKAQSQEFETLLPLTTLLSATHEISQPDKTIKGKIHFIFNNVSSLNSNHEKKIKKNKHNFLVTKEKPLVNL